MKTIKFLILLVIVLFAVSAPAEIYKYVDEQGNVHFTDDVNQVPEDQRDAFAASTEYTADTEAEEEGTETKSQDLNTDDGVKTDPELESSYDDEPENTDGLDEDSDNEGDVVQLQDGDSLNPSDDDQDGLEAGRKRLDALKKEIDQEYRALVEDKEKLANKKKALTTREDIITYNTRVENLNKRAEAYAKKGKQYKEQVEAYNERVIQINAQSKQKKK